MPPLQSRLYWKTMKGHSREIVGNVLKIMQKQADEYKFVIPVSKVHERVASANV
jgi:ABC-type histidine transport system ATPase subunit